MSLSMLRMSGIKNDQVNFSMNGGPWSPKSLIDMEPVIN